MTGVTKIKPLNQVSEKSCVSSDFSEASSLFMLETDWHFEEEIDCNTTITNDEDDFHPFPLSDEPVYEINDKNLVEENSFITSNRNFASQNDIHYSFLPEKWNESSKRSEESYSTQITEEEGRCTLPLTFSIPEGEGDDPDQPKDHLDRFAGKVQKPMIISKRSNSEGSAFSLESLSSETSEKARQIVDMASQMLKAVSFSKAEHHSQLDETTKVSNRRTSLDSQIILDKSILINEANSLGAATSSFLVNEVPTTTHSEAAQQLLGEADASKMSESTHPKTGSTVVPETAEDTQSQTESDLSVVHENISGTCDDAILNACNGLAEGTLHACHIFMRMFDHGDNDETGAPEEGMIEIIEEEKVGHGPTPILVVVPQVVRKGHILPHIVKGDEGTPLFLFQEKLREEQGEETTIPSPMSDCSPFEEEGGEEEKEEDNEEDSFIVLYGQPHVLCETRKKGFPKSMDDAFDFADADASSAFLESSNVLPKTLLQ